MTPELRERATDHLHRSRAEQGLPPLVDDPVTLDAVARLFRHAQTQTGTLEVSTEPAEGVRAGAEP